MAFNPFDVSAAFAAGTRREFEDTYKNLRGQVSPAVQAMATLDMPLEGRISKDKKFAYMESLPHWSRLREAEGRTTKSLKAVAFEVSQTLWQHSITWNPYDLANSQIETYESLGREAAELYLVLRERVVFQILTGATDSDLLPSIPNASDGASLFSATGGDGAARFGVTGGNIYTRSGTTAATYRTDVIGAIARMAQFQDTEGQPLFAPELLSAGVTVIAPVTLMEVMTEAFRADLVNSGSTNVIAAGNFTVNVEYSPRITGNTIYVFANSPRIKKPIFHIKDHELQIHERTRQNGSDDAIKNLEEGVYSDSADTYGIALPCGAVQIA